MGSVLGRRRRSWRKRLTCPGASWGRPRKRQLRGYWGVTTPYGSRAEGFWNDTGMSSYTNCAVHATSARHTSSATSVSHGTIFELGNIFTPEHASANPPKCSLVANVQKNYQLFLVVGEKRKYQFCLKAARMRITVHECAGLAPRFVKYSRGRAFTLGARGS